DLSRAQQGRVQLHVLLPLEAGVSERDLDQLPNRVALSGGDDVGVRLFLLEHEPHRADVIAGEAPVAVSVEVAERQPAGEAQLDAGDGVTDLSRHELDAAPG